MAIADSGRMRAALLLVVVGLAACATMPQPPLILGTPGARATAAITETVPYVPVRATVSGPSTAPVTLEQHIEASAIFDPRFRYAHRLGDRFQAGGHVSLTSAGVELRMLPYGEAVDAPMVVSAGAQLNALERISGSVTIWDVRVGLSMHPMLGRVQAILGAGFSAGRQNYDLSLPASLAQPPDVAPVPALLRLLRREGRLEGVLGLSYAIGDGRIGLAVQPFYVVARGAVSTRRCGYCFDELRTDSLDASWGAAFTVTLLGSVR
jgi:hypothetical protein